jgi:hypothetical protein
LAWNRYETLDNLEQAIQAIATTLVKCEFYHGLYSAFAQSPNSRNLDYKATFSVFEVRLPQLYAAAIVLSLKAKNYFDPPGKAGAWKSSLKPFSIEFKPLLDEITEKEIIIREVANSGALVEILGKCFPTKRLCSISCLLSVISYCLFGS